MKKNLKEILEESKLRVTYREWKKPPSLPYLVYLYKDSENFGADNKVYHSDENYQIELYSNEKDELNELVVEQILDDHDIYYEKSEIYVESERLYQVVYLI